MSTTSPVSARWIIAAAAALLAAGAPAFAQAPPAAGSAIDSRRSAAATDGATLAPPVPDPARWNGRPWGAVEMEPKVVRAGDTAIITATVLPTGGPTTSGFSCGNYGWGVVGTSQVALDSMPYCFELLDYEPKASEYVTVDIDRARVIWTGLPGASPTASLARELNPNAGPECYCHIDWWGARGNVAGCSKPIGTFQAGQTFKLFVRARTPAPSGCGTGGKYYLRDTNFSEPARFNGWNGVGWSDLAEMYYRFDTSPTGSRPVPDVTVSADPSSADVAATSTITALVTDPASSSPMPGQTVSFSATVGLLSALSAVTDADGVATVTLRSDGDPGVATVNAVAGIAASDSTTVTFTGAGTGQQGGTPIRRYFAEGTTQSMFTTDIALSNPGDTPTRATLTFLTDAGTTVEQQVTVPANGRRTVRLNTDVPGLGQAAVSTIVESMTPLVADRTITWDGTGYGSHAETAVAMPRTTWYFAEGATHSGLNLFYLIQNPNDAQAAVTVTYLRPAPLPPIVKTYLVGPASRANIWVDQEGAELASTDVSAVLESSLPVIAERAVYLDAGGLMFGAGHESAGIGDPSVRWFFAEGATGPYFDLFVLVANPGTRDAQVTASYLLPDGTTIVKHYLVGAQSRFNIWVDHEDAALANTAVSTVIESTNGVAVIAERALWWGGASWIEAHNSAGSTTTGTKWAVADGQLGGERGIETYLLVANTSDHAGMVAVTLLFEDGTTRVRGYDVPARSRFNVNVANEFPSATGKRFGAVVQSLGTTPAQIVVERAMYSNAGGVNWAAGSNALATKLQ
jgi:hypothetical protein